MSKSTCIDIPFNPWSTERLDAGEKTATTRTRPYGEAGDCFVVDDSIYRLTRVERTQLRDVANNWYAEEGCATPEEFQSVWADIHPIRGYDPGWDVFLHVFEEVSTHE